MNIGYKLKRILRIRQMSQQELADQSGVSLAMVKALANDKRDNTTIQTLSRLGAALGVSVTYLLDETAEHPWTLMDHIETELQSFILEPANLEYLRLAQEAARYRIPPAAAGKLIHCLAEILATED